MKIIKIFIYLFLKVLVAGFWTVAIIQIIEMKHINSRFWEFCPSFSTRIGIVNPLTYNFFNIPNLKQEPITNCTLNK